jgi:hypothetical protein
LIAQQDGPVCPGFPPVRWSPGYTYIEVRALDVAADAPAGPYDLRVGVYAPGRDTRLAILEADVPFEDNRAVLLDFEVP